MSIKKKLLIVLLALTCFLSLAVAAGCGGGSSNNERNRITVTYYYQEGVTPYTTTVEAGGKLNGFVLTRDGYVFEGLYTEPNGSGIQYVGRTSGLIDINSPITLYAHWSLRSYTISFSNGTYENAVIGTAESYDVLYNGSLSSVVFPSASLEGYDFDGWYLNSVRVTNGTTVADGMTILNNAWVSSATGGNIVLTPRFTEKQYTVTLDYNNNYFAGGENSREIKLSYSNTGLGDLLQPLQDIPGADFVGWSTDSTRLIEYEGVVERDITLYAIWDRYKNITVDLGSGPVPYKIYESDANYEPELSGYIFVAWFTNSSFSGSSRLGSLSYSNANETTVYYADFELARYTVTFVMPNAPSPVTYTINDFVQLPDAPEREHYEFLGWCEREDLSDAVKNALPSGSTGDKTLYPKYKGEDISVTLISDGRRVNATVEYGSNDKLYVPLMNGYAFTGWYTEETDGVRITDADGNPLTQWEYTAEGYTFYAQWSEKCYITVEVDLEGGVTDKDIITVSPELKEFYAVGERISLNFAAKGGYSITRIVNNTTNVTYLPSRPIAFDVPSGGYDFTVYAERMTYTVTLNLNGGISGTSSSRVVFDSSYVLPVPMKDGNTFTGWSYDGNMVTDEKGASLYPWAFTSNVTFNAVYAESGNRVIAISDAASLMQIYTNPTATFYLTRDVAFSGARNPSGITFSGMLDGNGHTISGISGSRGLFDTLTGTVCNVTLELSVHNATETGSPFRLGGVAGTANGATIYNVTVNGSIISDTNTDLGGVVGFTGTRTSAIYGCVNNAALRTIYTSSGSVGGIVGSNGVTISPFENNSNTGALTITQKAGGIIGYNGVSQTITDSRNSGAVTAETNFAGGIVGHNNSSLTLDGCTNTGVIASPSNNGKYVGGGGCTLRNARVEVSNSAQLRDIRNYVNGEVFVLTADINAGDWTAFDFGATLDGDGHSISFTGEYGLFRTLTGTVRNLTLNVGISGARADSLIRVGGVASEINGATINGVTVNGSISAETRADIGAIAGHTTGNASIITNCINNAAITGVAGSAGSAGGIVGSNERTVTSFENNSNTGAVRGTENVGGIIGYNSANQTLKNCVNSGTVTANNSAGGVIGNQNNYTAALDGCNSTGAISCSGANVGKYVGRGNATYTNMNRVVEISTEAQLAAMRLHIPTETYRLTRNIVLQNEWAAFDFSATLDGDGRTITGIVNSTGLFATLYGTVRNLTLVNVDIAGVSNTHYYIGAVASVINGATIHNVTVSGSVDGKGGTGGARAGGIAGHATGNPSSIYNCVNNATVEGNYNNTSSGATGGILGSYEANGEMPRFENNVNNIAVRGSCHVGGLIGYTSRNINIKNCVNNASVTATASYSGGLIGRANTNSVTIEASRTHDSIATGANYFGRYSGGGNVTYVNMNYRYEVASVSDLRNAIGAISSETYALCDDFTVDSTYSAFDFAATLDGAGHTITLNTSCGLFATLTGTVNNLVIDANITYTNSQSTSAYIGAVAGILTGATVHGVKVTGTIRGEGGVHVGGIAGYMNGAASSVYNCENSADITGEYYEGNGRNGATGGIIGSVNSTPSRFEANVNSGGVSGGRLVGGMIGYLNATTTVTNCYNSGRVSALSALCLRGTCDFAGGMVGYVASGTLTVNSSYSAENLITSDGGNAGQYVGRGTPSFINNDLQISISNVPRFKDIAGNIIPDKVYTLTGDLLLTDWEAFDFCATLDGGGRTITIENGTALFGVMSGTLRNLNIVVRNGLEGEQAVANLIEGSFENVTVNGSPLNA